MTGAGAKEIKGGIDGGAVEVGFGLEDDGLGGVPAEKPEKDGLEDIFGVFGVSEEPVGGAINHRA